MTKYFFRIICTLTIVFLTVPCIASIGIERTYSLPLSSEKLVSLEMPDGKRITVSTEELFIGAAAAFFPNESSSDILSAACVIINTPELSAEGIMYLSPEERRKAFGSECEEKCELYSNVWKSVHRQSLVLPDEASRSLFEYMEMLPMCEGTYTERLAFLFPGGGIKTEKEDKPRLRFILLLFNLYRAFYSH